MDFMFQVHGSWGSRSSRPEVFYKTEHLGTTLSEVVDNMDNIFLNIQCFDV